MNRIEKLFVMRKPQGFLKSLKQNMSTNKNQKITFSPKEGVSIKPSVKPDPVIEDVIEHVPRQLSFFRWWSSETGRNVSTAIIIAGSAIAAFMPVLKNTYCINLVRELFQSYSDGIHAKIDKDFRSKVITPTMEDLQLSPEEVASIKYFLTQGEAAGWGSVDLSTGAIVGVPNWFTFSDKSNNAKLTNATYGRRGFSTVKTAFEIDQNSESAKLLCEGLSVSVKAQKFALARETLKVKDGKIFYQEGSLAGLSVLFCLTMAKIVNKRLSLFRRVPLLRGLNYLYCVTFSTAVYFASKDFINRNMQSRLDEKVSKLSRDYAEGGVEYYTKQAQRNMAQRELVLGGDKRFNKQGEEIHEWIRKRNLKLQERKQTCETVLDSYS